MIASLTLILLAQLLGEGLARGTGLPVPGPVIGMALMLAFLALRDRARLGRFLPAPLADGTLEATARGLLANLSLMFVPAGAGIVGRLDVVQAQGVRLAVVVLVSTAVALVATVLVFLGVSRLMAGRGDGTP